MEDRRGHRRAQSRSVEGLDRLASARGREGIAWHYVRGHAGIPGNERVDAIADGLARGEPVALYRGPLAAYDVPIFTFPRIPVPKRRRASAGGRASAGAAYSYLSLVDGTPMRHPTWAECERRVKGHSGARFKKAMSRDDEAAILRSWHINPESLSGGASVR